MSITDELREWAKKLTHWWYDPVKGEYTYTTGTMSPSIDAVRLDSNITAIADRIDEQAEEESEAAWRRGYERGEDEAEFEDLDELRKEVQAEWVPLPRDADGAPIRIGDRVRIGRTEFEAIGFGNVTCDEEAYGVFMQRESGEYEWFNARCLRHYHAPTVEDVLREFAERWDDPAHYAKGELVEQYAAKLRLAGDE